MQKRANRVLSVYLDDTDVELVDMAYLVAMPFWRADKVSSDAAENECWDLGGQHKEDGIFNLFACPDLEAIVDEMVVSIKKKLINDQRVTLNIYGHSSDGVAELILAKKLGKYPQDKLLINFFSPDAKQTRAHKSEMNKAEVQSLVPFLRTVTEAIYYKKSDAVQESTKTKILRDFCIELYAESTFETKQQLVNALRNVIAVTLQRDKNRFSFFSTTTSGMKLLALLNAPTYKPLANLITGVNGESIRYRDLRCFVIGSNDESFFNSQYRESHYKVFKDKECPYSDASYTAVQDNFSALLLSR